MQFLSLYLHIPFCRVRCSYCAFNIYTDRLALADAYIAAVCQEAALLGRGEAVHTLYIGGGTPSLLAVPQVARLLAALHQQFSLASDAEITFEVNPGTTDLPYLRALRRLGVNRLSLGIQSTIPAELALYQRDHQVSDSTQVFDQARSAGFQNISLDLIYGAPGQSLTSWEYTLDYALGLLPEHFSLYAMQLESGTHLTRQVKYGQLAAPDDDLAADMYALATAKLVGYDQYEISSWARPGYESRHNQQYWLNLPYLGLGAGAHGCIDGFRTVNVMKPERYIQSLASAKHREYPFTPATQSYEVRSRSQEIFETIILNLRLLKKGLSYSDFENRYGQTLHDLYGKEIDLLKKQNLLVEKDGILYLTPTARLIANRVFAAFVPED